MAVVIWDWSASVIDWGSIMEHLDCVDTGDLER